MEEMARRDPELASLVANKRPYAHATPRKPMISSAAGTRVSNSQPEEADHSEEDGGEQGEEEEKGDRGEEGEEEGEEEEAEEEAEEAEEYEEEADNNTAYEEMDRDQEDQDEEDPAETEDLREGEIEEERPVAKDDHHSNNHIHVDKLSRSGMPQTTQGSKAPRLRQRPATSRTPSYEQVSEDDQTEGGSTEDEDGRSVYSDFAEEKEELPTDPYIIEELEKFQATFRGIEKRFRLINKIGEGT